MRSKSPTPDLHFKVIAVFKDKTTQVVGECISEQRLEGLLKKHEADTNVACLEVTLL